MVVLIREKQEETNDSTTSQVCLLAVWSLGPGLHGPGLWPQERISFCFGNLGSKGLQLRDIGHTITFYDSQRGFQKNNQWFHSRKLTWKPKKGPIKTTVLLKWGSMGFHVNLGECTPKDTLNPDEAGLDTWSQSATIQPQHRSAS